MAIGTAAAIAMGVSALASGASAIVSSNAANNATNAATDANNASNALTSQMYNNNVQTLSPYVQTGNAASSQINALLGLGGTAGTAAQNDYTSYVQNNPDLLAEYQNVAGQFGNDMAAYGQYHYNTYGQNEGRTMATTGGTSGTSATEAAQAAFNQYQNSTGYQFRLGEGMNALNSGYAGAGTVKSGAAMKAATEYGQNLASSEYTNYLNALSNQQGVGLSAAGAQAGVSTNYANTISNNNSNTASTIGNAGLVSASNINSSLNSLTSGILKYGVK